MAIAGITFGTLSYCLRESNPWLSNLLANAAIVVILLIPGEWLLVRVRSDIRRVETETDEVRATADSAKQTAEEAARSLADLRETLLDRQYDELAEHLDIYRDIVRAPTRSSLLRALRRATKEQIITERGVRSPVWWTDLHYRYVIDEGETELEVRLEDDFGSVISIHPWAETTSPEDFYAQLVSAVRDSGRDLGTGLNDPTESVEQLSDMLVTVATLRSQEPLGHRNTLFRIVERRDNWYFTETAIIPSDHLSYVIGRDRLNELDWDEHLYNKGWEGAGAALEFARRLYGVSRPVAVASDDAEGPGDEGL